MQAIYYIGLFTGVYMFLQVSGKWKRHRAYTLTCAPPNIEQNDACFNGREMKLEASVVHSVLVAHSKYYRQLSVPMQERFVTRVIRFAAKKRFIIKYRPPSAPLVILASAAAVKISFGLAQYRFSFYKYIRIYPEAFYGSQHFTLLAGNVQQNIITVSGHHLLNDYVQHSDGFHVGLHEMSHALYIQKMVIENGYAAKFRKKFMELMDCCQMGLSTERGGYRDLYSPYSEKDEQEFWAESVELFFERPNDLWAQYPEIFSAMTTLLNQDPRNSGDPVLRKGFMQWEQWRK
jgi:MtfA peptidase